MLPNSRYNTHCYVGTGSPGTARRGTAGYIIMLGTRVPLARTPPRHSQPSSPSPSPSSTSALGSSASPLSVCLPARLDLGLLCIALPVRGPFSPPPLTCDSIARSSNVRSHTSPVKPLLAPSPPVSRRHVEPSIVPRCYISHQAQGARLSRSRRAEEAQARRVTGAVGSSRWATCNAAA